MTTKSSNASITVLQYDVYVIRKDPNCFIVAEPAVHPTPKNPIKNHTATYHARLEDALSELSRRLCDKRLKTRSDAGLDDIDSLVQLIREHNEHIRRTFKLV